MLRGIVSIWGILGLAPMLQGAEMQDVEKASSLYSYCKHAEPDLDNDIFAYPFDTCYCVGFFLGVRAAYGFDLTASGRQPLCWPDGVTTEQMIRVFVGYMDNHSERLNDFPIFPLIDSAQEAFKCKRP
jgi:hypothetical protein